MKVFETREGACEHRWRAAQPIIGHNGVFNLGRIQPDCVYDPDRTKTLAFFREQLYVPEKAFLVVYHHDNKSGHVYEGLQVSAIASVPDKLEESTITFTMPGCGMFAFLLKDIVYFAFLLKDIVYVEVI